MKILNFSEVVFATDSSQLTKIMLSSKELPAFVTHLRSFDAIRLFSNLQNPTYYKDTQYSGGQVCMRC